ncbi:host attachment protein [Govanella unica]|uniref:Host attachment protein n=1 Tax=Govanella unica TaxID=2975056 RepID=A0A9X3U0L3_9PROT|nr:host attachment protein [Govania unica]MDA5194842.1 host attachment protein [Govania unica]
MQKPVTWVLIADGQRARVLKTNGSAVNGRKRDFTSAMDHEFIGNPLPSHELGTDRLGRARDGFGQSRHSMENPTDPHRYEKRRFAREIIAALEGERQKGAFGRLVIVAPPQALGDIRAELPNGLKSLVAAEINKDLTHVPPHELPAHLDGVM